MADPTPDTDAQGSEDRTVQFKINPDTLARLDAACDRFGIQRAHVLNRAAVSATQYLEQLPDPLAGMTFGTPTEVRYATGGLITGPQTEGTTEPPVVRRPLRDNPQA